MKSNGQYQRADQDDDPERQGVEADDQPEEYMFDIEDDLAGTTSGNQGQTPRKRLAIRICVYSTIFIVLAMGGVAFAVFFRRSRHKSSDLPPLNEPANSTQAGPPLKVYGYEILDKFPHDHEEFTQGIFYLNGCMYESDGMYGRSSMRYYNLTSGEEIKRQPLAPAVFAEGCTLVGDKVYQLTWKKQKGFIYEADTLNLVGNWEYQGEGWGLTTSDDEKILYMSDGTDEIRRLDPKTLEEKLPRLRVLDNNNQSVDQLNELEFVEGEIWSNVWYTDDVVRIDPSSGRVKSKIDFSGLLQEEDMIPDAKVDVLNGIAYDKADKTVYVTGKYWPKIYKVEITG
mmetsp:Transcript_2627/g.7904  ORF Transcript_2627/g.7904 Transcript_2627/m.7904 type:complete len:341 (-) Transcript_2627:412-1434(-)|eukprot:CAMPEP_0198722794 /NCGR_PEP_ID=MMETSP1475-20131203/419_1 /TAXON_ID= ORGANISM="Unidentified sp., Strain CCMP1999" /NCGR_SAMPLE_ID=MMETSP1475 /ASSEMBLY_ACC=CAM_ASM_001111 /LENGTH=340 /DNA_ID=CAMNT_0044483717 /DNA_START=39 /DNA_END=1061 /DNA_ORIENTATION=-